MVSMLQRNGQSWNCMWCRAANYGFSKRGDPAQATIGDLADDMASHGLSFGAVHSGRLGREDLAQVPMLIVTMNEIPGYRITKVHGDVFGLIVRARNILSILTRDRAV